MKLRVEEWDESILDAEDYRVERGLQRGALEALRRARRCGTDFVIREHGEVKSLRPQEAAPYEKLMLENLERLNLKIAELEGQSPSSLSLNDKPKS
jgi:hypothetical protein